MAQCNQGKDNKREKDSNLGSRAVTEKSYLPKLFDKKWNSHNLSFLSTSYLKSIYNPILNQFMKTNI